jgi:protein TonB
MNIATTPSRDTRTNDRLVLMLLIAAAFHALIILGIGFNPLDRVKQDPVTPTLDITIVNPNRELPTEEYDYLADASQDGAGNTAEKVKPQEETIAQSMSTPPPSEKLAATRVITREDSAVKNPEVTETPAETDSPSAAEMINRSMEMISLNEEINQSLKAYSTAPKQKYISARTREFLYASYMRDWVTKVERVGDLNYPDEARRRQLSGSLIVDVAIDQKGEVLEIKVVRPSGHKLLDDAAVRIVRLAAPFAPLPENIRKDTDILHITRTWEFTSSNRLQGR